MAMKEGIDSNFEYLSWEGILCSAAIHFDGDCTFTCMVIAEGATIPGRYNKIEYINWDGGKWKAKMANESGGTPNIKFPIKFILDGPSSSTSGPAIHVLDRNDKAWEIMWTGGISAKGNLYFNISKFRWQ